MYQYISKTSLENLGREPEVLETGFKTEKRCGVYSQILQIPQPQMAFSKRILGLSQRVHPVFVAKVQELVHAAGTTDPVEVQRLLKHHVHHYMCTGNLPNLTDRAYYPKAV